MDGYMDSCVIKHFSKMLTTILVVDMLCESFQLFAVCLKFCIIKYCEGEPNEPS